MKIAIIVYKVARLRKISYLTLFTSLLLSKTPERLSFNVIFIIIFPFLFLLKILFVAKYRNTRKLRN